LTKRKFTMWSKFIDFLVSSNIFRYSSLVEGRWRTKKGCLVRWLRIFSIYFGWISVPWEWQKSKLIGWNFIYLTYLTFVHLLLFVPFKLHLFFWKKKPITCKIVINWKLLFFFVNLLKKIEIYLIREWNNDWL